MAQNKLNLRQVQYQIIHRPLALMQLEHNAENKKLLTKALKAIHKGPQGKSHLSVLRAFLTESATKFDLTQRQEGFRQYLLRELDKVENDKGLFGLLSSFKLASS